MVNQHEHTASIGTPGVTVGSPYPYIVYGQARGLIGRHRTLKAAQRAAERDHAACLRYSQDSYSDVCVYEWRDERWSACPDEEGFFDYAQEERPEEGNHPYEDREYQEALV